MGICRVGGILYGIPFYSFCSKHSPQEKVQVDTFSEIKLNRFKDVEKLA